MDKHNKQLKSGPRGKAFCDTPGTSCTYGADDLCINCGRKKGWRALKKAANQTPVEDPQPGELTIIGHVSEFLGPRIDSPETEAFRILRHTLEPLGYYFVDFGEVNMPTVEMWFKLHERS